MWCFCWDRAAIILIIARMRTASTFRHYASACTLSSASCVFFSARKFQQCDSSNNEFCGLRLMVRVEVLGSDYLQNKRDVARIRCTRK